VRENYASLEDGFRLFFPDLMRFVALHRKSTENGTTQSTFEGSPIQEQVL
jgi:hypothetical protein